MRRIGMMSVAAMTALAFSAGLNARAAVVELFEDDDGFMAKLPNQDAATTMEWETKIVFNGKGAIKISGPNGNTQKYNPNIAGWAYNIVEAPKNDTEMRWVMFAWRKASGSDGIMVQFPDNGGWGAVAAAFAKPPAPGTRRYISGLNITGWTGIQLKEHAPKDAYEVHIRDLWADFTNFRLTGIALTPFDGVGYYDSIYLAHKQDELQAIVNKVLAVDPKDKTALTWGDLKSK